MLYKYRWIPTIKVTQFINTKNLDLTLRALADLIVGVLSTTNLQNVPFGNMI